jgi:hypothetical protein
MKLIIAGGRNYHLTPSDYKKLNALTITEVLSGGATGADRCGEEYGRLNDLTVTLHKADWATHSKAAGPIRNREMAKYADAVALFPGGRGTESMRREAVKAGIEIFDYRTSN